MHGVYIGVTCTGTIYVRGINVYICVCIAKDVRDRTLGGGGGSFFPPRHDLSTTTRAPASVGDDACPRACLPIHLVVGKKKIVRKPSPKNDRSDSAFFRHPLTAVETSPG